MALQCWAGGGLATANTRTTARRHGMTSKLAPVRMITTFTCRRPTHLLSKTYRCSISLTYKRKSDESALLKYLVQGKALESQNPTCWYPQSPCLTGVWSRQQPLGIQTLSTLPHYRSTQVKPECRQNRQEQFFGELLSSQRIVIF